MFRSAQAVMDELLLNGGDWTLTGFWQHQWRRRAPNEQSDLPAIPPLPATVPGAVHADLLRAGYIPDWQNGLDAFKSEWVEHRDWSLTKTVTVPESFTGRIMLECDGLDYSGTLLVDREEVSDFAGTHLRHHFDLSDRLRPGETHSLEFIFNTAPPDVEGVFGYTSRHRTFKPRFGYYWDWCKRVVNVGIWQDVRLVNYGGARFGHLRVLPRVHENLTSGDIRVVAEIEGSPQAIRYRLTGPDGGEIATGEQSVQAGANEITLGLEQVRLWWPATHGDQPLYRVELELIDGEGRASHRLSRTVGFKQVRWQMNPEAPEGAKPYVCEMNGRPLFLRGVNWVPLSPLYGTVTRERYEAYLHLYRHMNCNILRVWGGAILERPEFYELCDQLGLMVWQEFPLSSSGIDNWPPEDPEVIEDLKRIAAEYIERRCHHASHLLWCGGNELQGDVDGGKVGIGKPVDETHPLMSEWQRMVEAMDPGKRFQATSPSGPRFFAAPEDFGKGIHHQTHGPWGNLELKGRYRYYNDDDSLFRSETGCPGAASMTALRRHRGDQPLGPADESNPYWLVPGAAWIPDKDVTREFGPLPEGMTQLETMVKGSRYLQAESYRYAAEETRRKHPRCSGFIVWMGHDSMHCAANNSVIEIDASPKPAYDWLRGAFARRTVSFRHDRMCYQPGDRLTGEVWVTHDDDHQPAGGSVTIEMRRLNGEVLESMTVGVHGEGANLQVASLDWPVRACEERLFALHLCWNVASESIRRDVLFSQDEEHPLRPMLTLPAATLAFEVREGEPHGWTAVNRGAIAAVGVRLFSRTPNMAGLVGDNHLLLMPGEQAAWSVQTVWAGGPATASPPTEAHSGGRLAGDWAADWINMPPGASSPQRLPRPVAP